MNEIVQAEEYEIFEDVENVGLRKYNAGPMRHQRIYSGYPKGGGQLILGSACVYIDVYCDERKEVESSIRRALT